MTATVQQQLMDAVQAALVAATTLAGASVHADRPDDLPMPEVPALLLEGGDEAVTLVDYGVTLQQRDWQLHISAMATTPATARELAGQVEAALFASALGQPNGVPCKSLVLEGSKPAASGALQQRLHEQRQLWRLTYFTQGGQPYTPL